MILPNLIQTNDQTLNRIQVATREAMQRLQSEQILLSSNTVTKTIGTGDTVVNHGLGRAPQGYIVIGRNADATVWTSSTANSSQTKTIILKASASVAATIYFF